MVATAVAGAAEVPGVDAENVQSRGVADLVKALEGVCDSQRSYNNFSVDRESYKGQRITEKLQKNQVKLTKAINGVFEGVELTDAQRQKIQDAAMIEAVEGRANISKAGWPLIFGMLVISSLAALILFALIFNAASPELRREERERKEREAAQKA